MNPDSILDFSTDLSVFYSIEIGYFRPRSTCQHVDPSKSIRTNRHVAPFKLIGIYFFDVDLDTNEPVLVSVILDFSTTSLVFYSIIIRFSFLSFERFL